MIDNKRKALMENCHGQFKKELEIFLNDIENGINNALETVRVESYNRFFDIEKITMLLKKISDKLY